MPKPTTSCSANEEEEKVKEGEEEKAEEGEPKNLHSSKHYPVPIEAPQTLTECRFRHKNPAPVPIYAPQTISPVPL